MSYPSVLRVVTRSLGTLAVSALLAVPLVAQSTTTTTTGLPDAITREAWLTPPPEVASVVLAPRYLNV
ncbi:MAG: hypothetical protein ACRENP_28495, partial [Longimicrobiales bacterium]